MISGIKKALQIFSVFITSSLWGQHAISGTVTDANSGESIPGVNVYISDLSSGAVTDTDGKYTLNKLPKKELVIFIKII